jgi:tripartite-type tricarboxylate transporter receptor subunit TctC
MAPTGTPKAIVDKLNAGVNKVLSQPETKAAWAKQGATPLSMSPAEFDKYLRGDIDKWANVIKKAGIKVQ